MYSCTASSVNSRSGIAANPFTHSSMASCCVAIFNCFFILRLKRSSSGPELWEWDDGLLRNVGGVGDRGAYAKQKPAPATVEAVSRPSTGRQTICAPQKAACAGDCQFSLTAHLGLTRNPTPAEILAQM